MKSNESGMIVELGVAALAALMIVFIVGFFKNEQGFVNVYNFKETMNLPCGVSVFEITDNQKISYPLNITGYLNGCGWLPKDGKAGTFEIIDAKGLRVVNPKIITVNDTGEMPLSFKVDIFKADAVPTSDKGTVIITGTTGLMKLIPISF